MENGISLICGNLRHLRIRLLLFLCAPGDLGQTLFNPFGEAHSTKLMIETIQRAQRAVLILRGFYIALTGLRPSPAAPGTDVPRTLGTTYYE